MLMQEYVMLFYYKILLIWDPGKILLQIKIGAGFILPMLYSESCQYLCSRSRQLITNPILAENLVWL